MNYFNTPDFKDDLDYFNAKLQADPPEENIVTVTEEDGSSYKYIPISILNHMLNDVFDGLVQRQILVTEPHFNSSKSNVRLLVYHPTLGEWLTYDGVGAVPVQNVTDGPYKGSKVYTKLASENLSVPLSAAEAFKNAAKGIGRYFGADLNRDEDKTKQGREKIKVELPPPVPFDVENINSEFDLLSAIAKNQITAEQSEVIRKERNIKPAKSKKK